MRAIFDFIKNTLKKIDGYWIENAGHPIIVKGVLKPISTKDPLYHDGRGEFVQIYPQVLIYGFYDYPKMRSIQMFGIDAPDELDVQFNAEILCAKLGKMPEIGTLLSLEQSDWIVINRTWVYNRFIGKYRIELECQRYQESITTAGKNGIHIKSSSGHHMELDEE